MKDKSDFGIGWKALLIINLIVLGTVLYLQLFTKPVRQPQQWWIYTQEGDTIFLDGGSIDMSKARGLKHGRNDFLTGTSTHTFHRSGIIIQDKFR